MKLGGPVEVFRCVRGQPLGFARQHLGVGDRFPAASRKRALRTARPEGVGFQPRWGVEAFKSILLSEGELISSVLNFLHVPCSRRNLVIETSTVLARVHGNGDIDSSRLDLRLPGWGVQVAAFGRSALSTGALELTLAVPGSTLRRYLKLARLPDDFYLQVPITGHRNSPVIHWSTPAKQVAALLVAKGKRWLPQPAMHSGKPASSSSSASKDGQCATIASKDFDNETGSDKEGDLMGAWEPLSRALANVTAPLASKLTTVTQQELPPVPPPPEPLPWTEDSPPAREPGQLARGSRAARARQAAKLADATIRAHREPEVVPSPPPKKAGSAATASARGVASSSPAVHEDDDDKEDEDRVNEGVKGVGNKRGRVEGAEPVLDVVASGGVTTMANKGVYDAANTVRVKGEGVGAGRVSGGQDMPTGIPREGWELAAAEGERGPAGAVGTGSVPAQADNGAAVARGNMRGGWGGGSIPDASNPSPYSDRREHIIPYSDHVTGPQEERSLAAGLPSEPISSERDGKEVGPAEPPLISTYDPCSTNVEADFRSGSERG
eukprot:jgi/Mesvir1/29250/Mv02414-RA.1